MDLTIKKCRDLGNKITLHVYHPVKDGGGEGVGGKGGYIIYADRGGGGSGVREEEGVVGR